MVTALVILIVAVIALAVVAVRLHVDCKRARMQCGELEKGIAMQKLYLRNMSHEIRTPMNSICGFSQILSNTQMQEALTNRERMEYGTIIQSNTELLTSLIDDILDVGNMERGRYSLHKAPCKINDVCRKAVSTVVFRCPDGVKMYMTSDVDDDFTLSTDGKRVEQVLINYLTNAVKHTIEGEICLHVSPTENEGMLTMSVTDTGEGVPVDKAEQIFGRFERLNEDSTVGSGIGLAICRTIATQLGGEAKLDTRYTGGARFVFTHPLNDKSAAVK